MLHLPHEEQRSLLKLFDLYPEVGCPSEELRKKHLQTYPNSLKDGYEFSPWQE